MSQPVILITGASRGMGAATARLAAAQGYAVAVNYVRDEAAAQRVVDEIVSSGGRALAVQGDVGVEADILRLFATVDRELGPLSALVNNAGITAGFARVENVTAAQVEQVLRVNVTGPILCCREAVRRMSTAHGGTGGGIVNVTSTVTRVGGAGEWVHYAASKGAMNSFTLGLAREVAAEGIRVNAVSPGFVDTEIHAAAGDPERIHRVVPLIPMGRAGKAEEIAEAVMWLLSPAASFVAASILEVGGGR